MSVNSTKCWLSQKIKTELSAWTDPGLPYLRHERPLPAIISGMHAADDADGDAARNGRSRVTAKTRFRYRGETFRDDFPFGRTCVVPSCHYNISLFSFFRSKISTHYDVTRRLRGPTSLLSATRKRRGPERKTNAGSIACAKTKTTKNARAGCGTTMSLWSGTQVHKHPVHVRQSLDML